ncbi:PREDICTED: beta-defensin 105A isoform X2 [Cercocebus atys]|uniref:beta-defensin 105A isoform X2 n=1 Tax=Cercocebus atys TaxID=9531 RepID=UPI0005F43316|nr:PREDICTED: beta-defensin 105A isoform X2 [Cercocebus atys]
MALIRKTFYFVFAVFFILVQQPPGCQAGLEFSEPFPSDISWKAPSAAVSWHREVCCLRVVQAGSGEMQEGVPGE